MSKPEFSVVLHRIEVHASPGSDPADEFVWNLSATEAVNGTIILGGYLRRAEGSGYGQAQVAAYTGEQSWKDLTRTKATREGFEEWVSKYAAETMFDTARRALQLQAALMDFSFDIEVKAPDVELEFLGVAKRKRAKPRKELA